MRYHISVTTNAISVFLHQICHKYSKAYCLLHWHHARVRVAQDELRQSNVHASNGKLFFYRYALT